MMLGSSPQGFAAPDVPPDDVYNRCVRCGLCLPACPTYLETLVETSGPRGRIALVKAVGEGRLDLTSPGFVHQMHECLDCRACEAVCPSGVEYGRLVESARTQIERATAAHRSPGERALRALALGTLFDNPAMMRFAAALLRFYRRSGLQRLARSLGVLRALGLESLEAQAPAISGRFFVARDQHWRAKSPQPKGTAFLHAGCVMTVAFAEVNEATVRVLARAGCDVVAPSGQGCCGAIAVHAGDMNLGRRMAKRNIAAFENSGADFYVVNAAGCGSALKEYGTLFAGDAEWSERAAAFSGRVRDVSEFLDGIGIDPGLGRIDAVVAYQDACHLIHAQRIGGAPRRLLAQIPGVVQREIDEAAICCGSAGIYNVTQPAMSARLKRRKVEHLLAVEPDVIVTANPGCALQVSAGLRDAGRTLPVKHVVQMLDDAYDAAERSRSRNPR